jgi:hypothetical protein
MAFNPQDGSRVELTVVGSAKLLMRLQRLGHRPVLSHANRSILQLRS